MLISRSEAKAIRASKVLLVIEASGGGSGRHVVELAQGLVAAGAEVHLVYSDLRADAMFRESLATLERVHVHQIPMHREPHWSDVDCLYAIRRYIQAAGEFDIVHAHSSKAGALARMAAAGTRATTVYTPHAMRTMDSTLNSAIRQFYRFVEVGLARTTCDAVIAVSEFERRHIVAQGVPPAKLYVVPNGIPQPPTPDRAAIRADLGIPEDHACIGFIGRLVPQKAPARFVAALAGVLRRAPKVSGVVLGTGPLEAQVHELAADLGVAERMVWVTDRTGPAVLPAFDMLVMPSLYEGMPYVLLEAAAVGVPVIATDVGGVTETVRSGVTGFVVPQNAPDLLVDRMLLLVEDETVRTAMARASLLRSRELSVEHMVGETIEVYRYATLTRQARDHRASVRVAPPTAPARLDHVAR